MDGRAEGPAPSITALNPLGSVLALDWAQDSHFFCDLEGSAFLLTPAVPDSWVELAVTWLGIKMGKAWPWAGTSKNGVFRFPTALTWLEMMEWRQEETVWGLSQAVPLSLSLGRFLG